MTDIDSREKVKEEPTVKSETESNGEGDEEEKKENCVTPEAEGTKKEESNDSEASESKEDTKKLNGDAEKPDNSAQWNFTRDARNRVKLYVLCEQRIWDDRGTGHVACLPMPDNSGFHAIVVRLEANEKNVLESKILMDTVYQKQQETLIVWSESDSCDLALSFQEKSGCEEIWSKICQVQGKDPGDSEGAGSNDDMDDGELSEGASGSGASHAFAKATTLPPVEMGRLVEIELFLSNQVNSGMQRERVAHAIESQNYIAKLCDLFTMCEDLENSKGLKSLYNIAKHLFMINRNAVIEQLVDDKHLKDVMGMLEYDPLSSEKKKHREFLYEKSRFRQILPMENAALKEKIHHVYRVQYLQDVCLPAPSLFEENMLSALNSYLFFNRVDIVSMILEDKLLLRELFSQLRDSSTTVRRRRDLVFFLKELCAMSNTLQNNGPQSKEAFYKTLVHNEILFAVEPCIRSPDAETRSTITDVLNMVAEFSPQTVRDFLLRQSKDKKDEDVLMNLLLNHITTDRDPELHSATLMLQVFRMLLDPENMAQKGDKNEFLSLFYQRCMPNVSSFVVQNVSDSQKPKKDDYHTAKKLSLVLRLLNFCITHHAMPMRTFIIRHDFLNKALVLLNSKHHFLAHNALKLLRSVIQQKDEFYYRYVVEKKVFDKVVECFIDNGRRNNLLNSAIIEMFEFMRTEDLKTLIAHVVERHSDNLLRNGFVKTFADLKLRYEQQKDREEEMRRGREEEKESGRWKRERDMEKEEQWFDDDEDDEDEENKDKDKAATSSNNGATPSPGRKSGAEPMFPKMKLAAKDVDEDTGVFSTGIAPSIKLTASLGLATAPKIVIKMDGSRSRSPSPGTLAREDEVSSSQASSSSSSPSLPSSNKRSPSPASSPAPKKGLVEYDDSDSDSDGEGTSNEKEEGVNDSLPSSSTGSPNREEEGGEGGGGESTSVRKDRIDKDRDNDDVSSTSGDDDDRQTPSTVTNNRKRESDEGDHSPKRRRLDEVPPARGSLSPRPSPPPVDPVAH